MLCNKDYFDIALDLFELFEHVTQPCLPSSVYCKSMHGILFSTLPCDRQVRCRPGLCATVDCVGHSLARKRKCGRRLIGIYTVGHKKFHFVFDYNWRVSWSILILFVPMEIGVNTPQRS